MNKYMIFVTLVYVHTIVARVTNAASSVDSEYAAFSTVFSDDMVLQRSTQDRNIQAALYGPVGKAFSKSEHKLFVKFQNKLLPATVDIQQLSWKVVLESRAKSGGSFDISLHLQQNKKEKSVLLDRLQRVTYGDVWHCSGQSNMALPLNFTFAKDQALKALGSGRYDHLRLLLLAGMNDVPEEQFSALPSYASPLPKYPSAGKWYNGSASLKEKLQNKDCCQADSEEIGCVYRQTTKYGFPIVKTPIPKYSVRMLSFSATCLYFGLNLMKQIEETENEQVPIGLISTAVGGTQIEAWTSNSSQHCQMCDRGSMRAKPGHLFNAFVAPLVNMTIKGWIYYQGENNCGCEKNSPGADYRCSQLQLVDSWRKAWSVTPGTTPPDAPFGLVTLPDGTGEGGGNVIHQFRIQQTGGYGYVPNLLQKNVFAAQAYDLGDPWGGYLKQKENCIKSGCCVDFSKVKDYDPVSNFTQNQHCQDHGFKIDKKIDGNWLTTTQHSLFNWGAIHPRSKQRIGQRLAVAAMGSAYNSPYYLDGSPSLLACEARTDANTLSIYFNMDMKSSADTLTIEKTIVASKELQFCIGEDCTDFKRLNTSNLFYVNRTAFKAVISLPESETSVVQVQYAFSPSPCVDVEDKNLNQGLVPAPLNNCVVKTKKFSLPLSPFSVRIMNGKLCENIGFGIDTLLSTQKVVKKA